MADESGKRVDIAPGGKVQNGQGRQLPPITVKIKTPPVKQPAKPKK